jgi:hypothetical protein
MNEEKLAKLQTIKATCGESWVKEGVSPKGRPTMWCYSPEGGLFEIHICETREDVEASNRGEW